MQGKDRAEWLADKICNGGDYCKEAAIVLVQQAEEIERWQLILNERGQVHGESSRVYARLACAVRAGADDSALAKMLRDEVKSRDPKRASAA